MRKPILAALLTLIVFAAPEAAGQDAVTAPAATPVTPAAKTLLDHVREARTARLAGNNQAWRDAVTKALALAPDHPDLLISAARAEAALGNNDAALARLGDALRRGAGLDLLQVQEFAKLHSWRAFATLAKRASANAEPVAKASQFALLALGSQSEGIAYDPVSKRLFAGSVRGEIFAIDSNGAVTTFVHGGTGLREVYGLKVDPARRLLWAATAVFADAPQTQGATAKADVGMSGLVAFDLNDGKVVAARWLDERPALHGFNDMALAANGDVYVTDTAASAVYVLRSDATAIELFVRDPRLSFPNGVVILPDQSALIVASTEGLKRIEIASRQMTRIGVPQDATVNSIDGLALDGNDLIGVQGSPYFERVVRIVMDWRKNTVTSVKVLNAHTPREYAFTTAAIGGDFLYVVGGMPATDPLGKPLASEAKPQIVRLRIVDEPSDFLGLSLDL